jgi:hypothetical protein
MQFLVHFYVLCDTFSFINFFLLETKYVLCLKGGILATILIFLSHRYFSVSCGFASEQKNNKLVVYFWPSYHYCEIKVG